MITREKVKRLERALDETDGGGLVIPIMATPAEAEAIRQEAKRQGRKTIGIPINTGETIISYHKPLNNNQNNQL